MKSCTKFGKAAAAAALLLGAVAFSNQASAQSGMQPADPGQQPSDKGQQPSDKGQQPSDKQPGTMSSSSMVTVPAVVEKIDKDKGEVTIKGPQGRMLDAKAGPDIHLDQVHVGDKVTVSYYDEVAVSLQKASGTPKMTTTTVERNGVTAMQQTVTARIVSVDTAKNTVVVRGPRGEHTLKVEDPDLQGRLKQIKPGENVDVIYTQAIAITMEPRKK
jgi:hypothetical protein